MSHQHVSPPTDEHLIEYFRQPEELMDQRVLARVQRWRSTASEQDRRRRMQALLVAGHVLKAGKGDDADLGLFLPMRCEHCCGTCGGYTEHRTLTAHTLACEACGAISAVVFTECRCGECPADAGATPPEDVTA